MYAPPAAPADKVAVGVPVLTLITANLAVAVDTPPTAKSTVELFAYNSPEVWFQKASPPVEQDPNVGVVPPSKHCEEVPAVTCASTPVAFVYKGPPLDEKVEKVMVLEAVIVPILTRFPETSILLVPAPAPVLIPVVPFKVVPVIVFAVAMVPNPEAIEPEARAPTVVKLEVSTPVPRVVPDSTSVALI